MRLSFFTQTDLNFQDYFYFMEIVIDVIFGLDIVINFLTAYERSDGEVEYRVKRIAINYITGFFWIDLLSTFPFYLFL